MPSNKLDQKYEREESFGQRVGSQIVARTFYMAFPGLPQQNPLVQAHWIRVFGDAWCWQVNAALKNKTSNQECKEVEGIEIQSPARKKKTKSSEQIVCLHDADLPARGEEAYPKKNGRDFYFAMAPSIRLDYPHPINGGALHKSDKPVNALPRLTAVLQVPFRPLDIVIGISRGYD